MSFNFKKVWVIPYVLFIFPAFAHANTGSIEVLQQRIEALEKQNLQILQQLSQLTAMQGGPQLIESSGDKVVGNVTEQVGPIQPVMVPDVVRTESDNNGLSFYGFARADAIFDDSRPSALQTPTFILSEDPALGTDNDSSFTFHTRLTRLGMNYKGKSLGILGGARVSAKVETDFQNGGRESRAVARYRHVYAKLDWDSSSLLVGQTSDIISPLFPSANGDTLMWNAGNLGDRRMQVRYSYNASDALSLTVGAGLTGAINSQDVDGNGLRDGEDATLPNFQFRLGYSVMDGGIGVWGHYGKEETDVLFNNENEFDNYSIGVDYQYRFNDFASIKGEVWYGQALGDFRGGIGQSVNTVTGEEIVSQGGWVELGLKPFRSYTAAIGYTVDNPDNNDLVNNARKLNRTWYIANKFQPTSSLVLGFDYINWHTEYIGLPKGTDNRFNLYSIYYF